VLLLGLGGGVVELLEQATVAGQLSSASTIDVVVVCEDAQLRHHVLDLVVAVLVTTWHASFSSVPLTKHMLVPVNAQRPNCVSIESEVGGVGAARTRSFFDNLAELELPTELQPTVATAYQNFRNRHGSSDEHQIKIIITAAVSAKPSEVQQIYDCTTLHESLIALLSANTERGR
jgi:hypothetical protein